MTAIPDEVPAPPLTHLRRAGVSLLLDTGGPDLPAVLHWGADLGPLTPAELAELAAGLRRPVRPGNPEHRPVGIVPEHTHAWFGVPGLAGHRDGAAWSPYFRLTAIRLRDRAAAGRAGRTAEPDGGTAEPDGGTMEPDGGTMEPAGAAAGAPDDAGESALLTVVAVDVAAALELEIEVELDPGGLVRVRAGVRNTHPTGRYTVDQLGVALPVPPRATELLDLTGRWCRERSPQRQAFTVGTRLREGRRGRTGLDATLLLVAGTAGFGFRGGEVWGLHVGWSGNHRSYAERTPEGESVLGGGELLLPGEVSLAPGESYRTPWVYGGYGQGLDDMSARFHRHLRRQVEPARDRRPVVVNTWEAVYFDHDLDRLVALADAAAEIGAERFVLDDGWMRHRRSDRAGLGDWYVDEGVWPQGLHPLVARVREHGMEFGLWVEPEMVNTDSDLARAHPEWILATGDRTPRASRWQQVLDLARPEAYAHVLSRLDALVSEYRIDYLKWDHNRDLIDAGHHPDGGAGVHAQTRAVYRLIDTLRQRHPRLQIESCSSGGGRVDLGILARTDRIWGSDCIDPLERQSIQRWTQLLLPPELIGSHVGAGRAHTTGRTHSLTFRAGTALFGSFGVEWDLTTATAAQRAELAWWVRCYQRYRGLLHGGTVVRADHPDPALWVHAVVAPDRTEALLAFVAPGTATTASPGPVILPGLDPDRTYRVRLLAPDPGSVSGPGGLDPQVQPAWLTGDGVRLSGRVLAAAGVQAPVLGPEQLALVHLSAA